MFAQVADQAEHVLGHQAAEGAVEYTLTITLPCGRTLPSSRWCSARTGSYQMGLVGLRPLMWCSMSPLAGVAS